jgi:hypothetical protein
VATRAATQRTQPDAHTGARQAYRVVRVGFTVAPILFGLDKPATCS